VAHNTPDKWIEDEKDMNEALSKLVGSALRDSYSYNDWMKMPILEKWYVWGYDHARYGKTYVDPISQAVKEREMWEKGFQDGKADREELEEELDGRVQ
jgi:hypothetical protein